MLILIVDWGIKALMLVIIISSVLSWIRPDPRDPLVKALNTVVEPVLLPIRSVLPATGPFDLSPTVAIILLWLLQSLLHNALSGSLR